MIRYVVSRTDPEDPGLVQWWDNAQGWVEHRFDAQLFESVSDARDSAPPGSHINAVAVTLDVIPGVWVA